tara:strand:+ start:243 stop:395 length:153 start_codon:yes stop_codon:yes gene_type:complete
MKNTLTLSRTESLRAYELELWAIVKQKGNSKAYKNGVIKEISRVQNLIKK